MAGVNRVTLLDCRCTEVYQTTRVSSVNDIASRESRQKLVTDVVTSPTSRSSVLKEWAVWFWGSSLFLFCSRRFFPTWTVGI